MNGKMKNLSLLALIFSTLAFGPTPAAFAAGKDSLVFGTTSEFETLNPMIAQQGATNYMLYLAFRPLVALSYDGKWIPILLTKIPTIENKMVKKVSGGLEIQIEIKPEAQWGDGKPVTCKDVDFAWRLGKSPNVSNPNREAYENITSIKWDEKTPKKCLLVSKVARYNYVANFFDPLPEHLEGPIFEKFKDQPEGYDRNTLYTKDPSNPGLYNGPYLVSEVKLGSHIQFKVNPKFWGKKPSIQQIVFKFIPNGNTITTRMQAGDIEAAIPSAGLTLDQATAFEKKIKAENLPFQVQYVDGITYAHIDLNLDNPILSDIRVRKALALAMNKIEINQSFLEGKAKPAYHFAPPVSPWYTEQVSKYEYNKKAAAKLLDEAGWKPGPNGIRTKDGKTLSLTIYGGAGNKLVDNIEAYLQAQYKSIGIELKIKNEPGRVFFGDTIKNRKFDLAFYSWASLPEQSPRTTLHSEMIPSAKNSLSGQNNPGYRSPEMDKLIDQLEAEFNDKKRAEIGKKILKLYAEDVPVLSVYYRPTNAVVPKDLKGYKVSPHISFETLYAETWSR